MRGRALVLLLGAFLLSGCATRLGPYEDEPPMVADSAPTLVRGPSLDEGVVEVQPAAWRGRRCGCRPRKCWEFMVAPYGWLAGTSGRTVIDGEETRYNISFEDLLERTDGGFQLAAEARWCRWFLHFDGTIARLSDQFDLGLATTDFQLDQLILELDLGYRVLGPAFGQRTSPCRVWCGDSSKSIATW